MVRNFWPTCIMLFYIFFCNNSKVELHLISSFSLTRSLLVPYAYVSIKSIDCILFSSFERKAILLIYSVKTYFSLLNLCCVFNISFLLFMNSLSFFLNTIYVNFVFFSKYFILFPISVASK